MDILQKEQKKQKMAFDFESAELSFELDELGLDLDHLFDKSIDQTKSDKKHQTSENL